MLPVTSRLTASSRFINLSREMERRIGQDFQNAERER